MATWVILLIFGAWEIAAGVLGITFHARRPYMTPLWKRLSYAVSFMALLMGVLFIALALSYLLSPS